MIIIKRLKIIFSLIKRDVRYSFNINFIAYLLILIFFILLNFITIYKLSPFQRLNRIDLFYELYKGIPYIENIKDFSFPLIWFLINSSLLFIVGSYTYEDLKKNGVYLLTRVGKLEYFYLSKVIWIIGNVLFFYFCIFGISFIEGLVALPRASGMNLFLDVKISSNNFIFTMVVLYIITSITLCVFQTLLSLVIKPAYAYLITIIVLCISIFSKNWIFPGQHSLLLRHEPFDKLHKLTLEKSISYNVILLILLFIIGCIYTSRKDIY